jgi:hypothetical protein
MMLEPEDRRVLRTGVPIVAALVVLGAIGVAQEDSPLAAFLAVGTGLVLAWLVSVAVRPIIRRRIEADVQVRDSPLRSATAAVVGIAIGAALGSQLHDLAGAAIGLGLVTAVMGFPFIALVVSKGGR